MSHKLLTLMAAGLVLFACQKEGAEEDILVTGNHLTFTATIDDAGTRTSVDGTKISWNPAEEINIFYGASEGSKFVSQNTEPSQSVTFSGTLTAFTGTTEAGEPNSFWAIYPYDELNSSSGSSVTAYLPENQVGVPNNVPDKALMMVAKASGLALSFKQVCARIKVNVTTSGIEKIEIRGNNDETIAGSAVITMNSQGLPEWQDAGTGAGKVIELVPESGTTFEEAEYSIPIYPQTFSAGFTMTCYKEGEKGSYSTGAVTFGRNQVRTVNTNKVTEWTSLHPNNVIYYTSSDGEVVAPFNPDAFGVNILSNEYVDGRGVITFDGDVTSIGSEAFYSCSSLTNIILPDVVTSIGGRAFQGCSSLTDISIPEGVRSIGIVAFQGCSSLSSISIPEGVTKISIWAFAGCSSLSSITIPKGVTSIDDDAFEDCTSLTCINIPEEVTSIGNAAFRNCSSLTSITLPEGVTSIGMRTFFDCSNLVDITIPKGVTNIGEMAFANCTSLTSIIIPEGVTSIGGAAFGQCSSLTTMEILGQTPPEIDQSSFSECNCTFMVPVESYLSYKDASDWSDYFERINPIIPDEPATGRYYGGWYISAEEGDSISFHYSLGDGNDGDEYFRVYVGGIQVYEDHGYGDCAGDFSYRFEEPFTGWLYLDWGWSCYLSDITSDALVLGRGQVYGPGDLAFNDRWSTAPSYVFEYYQHNLTVHK